VSKQGKLSNFGHAFQSLCQMKRIGNALSLGIKNRHFMMSGGNIVVLQRILGHSDIRVTMRYAHFAPDHLEDALTNNPLSILGAKMPAKSGGKMATEVLSGNNSG